jgi:hypothetical protein
MKLTPFNQLTAKVESAIVGPTEAILNLPNPLTISVTTTGAARVEYTIDKALTDWKPWNKGSVTAYTEDILVADVYAIRLYVESGSAVMNLVGGRNG